MRHGHYEFNENGVCENPTVFFEMKFGKHVKCTLSVAQNSEYPPLWDYAYSVNYHNGGSFGGANVVSGWPSEDLAKSAALHWTLTQYESASKREPEVFAKDAARMADLIRKRLAELPEPIEPTILFNYKTDQYSLAL